MIRKVTKIPEYVWVSLERYGNTIMSKKDIKSIGGEEKVLNLLKKKGYVCTLSEPTEQIVYNDNAYVTAIEHMVVKEVKDE